MTERTPYRLTLSSDERRAVDWIGERYAHGGGLYRVLWGECLRQPPEADWDSPQDITFLVPEPAAWTIRDIGDQDNWACFGEDLEQKMTEFVSGIV